MQKYLPPPDITVLLDIAPEAAARRKIADRDKYERDLALLARVRESYLDQAAAKPGSGEGGAGSPWLRLDGNRDRDAVAADVQAAVLAMM
jgi:thymidylate kinase